MNKGEDSGAGLRAFIACGIAEAVRDRLRELHGRLCRLEASVKWVRPESMHLTLRFLGNIGPEQVDLVDEALAGAVAGIRPVSIEVRGFGLFPSEKRPRVIWLGLSRGGPELAALFERLERELIARGFGPADKPFSPHLTLGRVKSPRGLERTLEALAREAEQGFGGFVADRVTLFQSRLRPEGALYTPLRERSLAGE